jgi:hypothetical protein
LGQGYLLAPLSQSSTNSTLRAPSATVLRASIIAMTVRDDEINVRPGRIRHGNRGAKRPKSFVGQVMRAARRAGHTGKGFGRERSRGSSTFDGAGVADLRTGAPDGDSELRRLMIGRAAKLERLGLAERVAPGCWTLKPGIEGTLRDLSVRGDIIKTMHRAIAGAGREPDLTGFALHGDEATAPVQGRLVARGLHDDPI